MFGCTCHEHFACTSNTLFVPGCLVQPNSKIDNILAQIVALCVYHPPTCCFLFRSSAVMANPKQKLTFE